MRDSRAGFTTILRTLPLVCSPPLCSFLLPLSPSCVFACTPLHPSLRDDRVCRALVCKRLCQHLRSGAANACPPIGQDGSMEGRKCKTERRRKGTATADGPAHLERARMRSRHVSTRSALQELQLEQHSSPRLSSLSLTLLVRLPRCADVSPVPNACACDAALGVAHLPLATFPALDPWRGDHSPRKAALQHCAARAPVAVDRRARARAPGPPRGRRRHSGRASAARARAPGGPSRPSSRAREGAGSPSRLGRPPSSSGRRAGLALSQATNNRRTRTMAAVRPLVAVQGIDGEATEQVRALEDGRGDGEGGGSRAAMASPPAGLGRTPERSTHAPNWFLFVYR